MKHLLLHGVTSALLVLVVGCTATGQAHYSASVTTPQLILIEPGIQVVADYDEPVFYTDNYYWRYDSGVWYRSNNHLRGWVRFEAIPPRLRRIERPTAYIRYRGEARGRAAVVKPTPVQPPRDQRDDRQEVRDDRRDDRQDAKEERKEVRDDLKDARKDAKDDRKDDRQDAKEERKEVRDDLKDARKDAKDDRKDAKDERKEDRQDAKDDRKDAKKRK